VLPSIRKKGEYKIKQELTLEFELKLSIMDEKISEIKQNAEKEYTLLRISKEKELEHSRKQIELLTNHLKNHTEIIKDDLIYILTNEDDLKQNNLWFKGKDVATILGYQKQNDAIKKHVDEDEKIIFEELYLRLQGIRIADP
jgi:prophage antirepressor-like protein